MHTDPTSAVGEDRVPTARTRRARHGALAALAFGGAGALVAGAVLGGALDATAVLPGTVHPLLAASGRAAVRGQGDPAAAFNALVPPGAWSGPPLSAPAALATRGQGPRTPVSSPATASAPPSGGSVVVPFDPPHGAGTAPAPTPPAAPVPGGLAVPVPAAVSGAGGAVQTTLGALASGAVSGVTSTVTGTASSVSPPPSAPSATTLGGLLP